MGDWVQAITVLLILGVIFVNGWTDAPNAIVSVVCTGTLSFPKAVFLAAVFNLIGILGVFAFGFPVGETVAGMMDFSASESVLSSGAICAGMTAVIIFSVGAWRFGIPTSESHALLSGLTGAALALNHFNGIGVEEWKKVLYGLAVSLAVGLMLGWMAAKCLKSPLAKAGKRLRKKLQITTAALLALLHGVQDGQKFLAVFLLLLGNGTADRRILRHTVFLVAAGMVLGTLAGGKKIVENVGENMAHLSDEAGIASDLAAIACMGAASASGVPVSTTHIKTTAVMGAAAATGKGNLSFRKIGGMFAAWGLTFPVCGALGYIVTTLWKLAVQCFL